MHVPTAKELPRGGRLGILKDLRTLDRTATMATQQHFKDLTGAMAQRYTTDNGVRRQNPAYVPAAASASSAPHPIAAAVPFVNQATALAVVPVPTAPALEEEEEIVVVPTEGYCAAVARYEAEVEVSGLQRAFGVRSSALNTVLINHPAPIAMSA
ncbi:hypothetical protein THAOC_29787 [Thalassiosira oceanica]|uniref:Uncharacterized protein n=1 Tax=Thalassiosira oceanica TaxID=159749 RepID=K0RWE2_THAOC|nr:hypothetical protein THAOC_29787 [Thalassiosira oceanica]|eukprot:EJK51077.1 hypothetical protein THAOC_29787 [Thalassiosira oceanica]